MKKSGFRIFLFCMVVLVVIGLVTGSAYATNGYFAHGYSIKNKALGGAGTALPLDSLAAASNPAGMVFVGSRVDVSVSLFNPNRSYKVTGSPGFLTGTPPLEVESDSEWFVIPSLGFNKMMNENYSLGISIYGNGGMNTDYDHIVYPSPAGTSPTGVDLMQLFIVPTYARKFMGNHAIGISPIFAYQAFEAQGLGTFMLNSSDPTNLTDNGHDSSIGYGGRIGYMGEIVPGLFIGASYQTKIWMDEFDDYAGLFAEQGDFDIPSNWSAGIAYKTTNGLTFVFDVQQIFYSEVDSISNPLLPNLISADKLGDDDGAGFGWEDMTVYKFGVQWEPNDEWVWRAGYSYGEQPIPDDEVLFNMIAPGVIEHHVTGGMTKKLSNGQEFNLAVMYAVENSVKGDLPAMFGPPQEIELEMDQWEFTVGYSKSF